VWLAGLATAASLGSLWVLAGGVALALSSIAVLGRRHRLLGAVIAALSVQALLRIPAIGFFGVPSLITLVAVAPVLVVGWQRAGSRTRRFIAWTIAGAAAFALVATAGLGVAALQARDHVTAGVDEAEAGLDAVRTGDQPGASAHFDRATAEFDAARHAVQAPWALPARLVPGLGHQAAALVAVTDSGTTLTERAGEAAMTAPYQQLRAKAGQIDLATLAQMQEPVARSAEALAAAQRAVEQVDSPWLVPMLADPVQRFEAKINQALPEAELARGALQVAPGLLGGEGTRRYFISFMNPAEARFQGGFIGSYGILTAQDGKVTLERSGPIEDLSDAPGADHRTLSGPALYLQRYGRFQPARFLQNLTASPDLPDNASAIAKLYPQAGGTPIQGVISVDPEGLSALLKLTGPISVAGLDTPLTSETAASFLLRDQYLTSGPQSARKDRLTDVSKATFDALVGRDLPSPREIGAALGPAMHGGHLLFTSFDPGESAFLTGVGMSGDFLGGAVDAGPSAPDGGGSDWFSVRTSNAGGNKIDSFLDREVTYDAAVDPATGTAQATATVALHNTAPASGLPDYLIGNIYGAPRGTNLTYLGFFTAGTLTGATRDGAPIGVESQREFGGNVYSTRLDIPPGATVRVTFRLRVNVGDGTRAGEDYRLAVGHQPLATDDRLVVRIHPVGYVAVSAQGWGATATLDEAGTVQMEGSPSTDVSLRIGFASP